MREILTIIAAALVAVLTVALAAPPLVDWDARRGEIAAEIGERLGAQVAIGGPVSLRLLPAPRLAVGSLDVERPGLELRTRAAALELSPTALLRGRFDFTQISLARPQIAIDPTRLDFSAAEHARVGIERLQIEDGAIRLVGAAPVVFEHIDLTGAADSLAGPYRGAGRRIGASPVDFQFSTAPIEEGKLRGKLALDAPASGVQVEFDGALAITDGSPAFDGAVVATGAGQKGGAPPWRAAFALKATPRGAEAEKIDARLGDLDHALSASGSARYAPGAPIDVRLSAHNLDLDRFRSVYGGSALSAASLPASLNLVLAAESATLGADTLTQPQATLRLAPGAAPAVTFDAGAPGRAHIAYAGAFDPARPGMIDGRLDLSTREPGKLGAWIAPAIPEAARWLEAAPFSRIKVGAKLRTGPAGLEAQVSEADLDRSRLSGRIDWRAASDGAPAKLSARLTSPALDIDGLPDLSAFRSLDKGADLALSLDAQAIKIARFGQSSADAGNIALTLGRTGGVTTLDRLSIENLGGATLTGAGRFGPRGGGIDLRLDADRLGDLAGLVQRVAPSGAARALVARASALSPAHLTFGLATDAAGAIAELNLSGEAGGTKLSGQARPSGDRSRIEGRLHAESADASALLLQAGLPVLPLKGLGGARIDASVAGAPGDAMRTRAHGEVAGVKLDFDGETTVALDRASLRGKAKATSADVAPLVQLLAFGAPDLTEAWPLDLSGDVSIASDGARLDDLAGRAAGVAVQGRLSRASTGGVAGALRLDRLSVASLAALTLGPAQPARPGALWPTLKFAQPRFDIPPADLDLTIDRLDLGAAAGRDARFKLSLTPGVARASGLDMRLAGGRVGGDVTLRREGGAALARARLSAEGVSFREGPFAARASGRVDAAGAGDSMAELVGSLAGAGHVRFADLTIAAAAPDAVGATVAGVEAQDAPVEQRKLLARLGSALDAGPQRIPEIDADIGLAAGRATIGPVDVRFPGNPARIGATLDLRGALVAVHETLSAQAPWDWKNAPPHIDIDWTGPLSAPTRSLSADALAAALAERAIARERARNAALEADIRERAFFNRRLKFDRKIEADRRAEEERRKAADAARAEQERLEHDRLAQERAAEQARQAEEAARKAREKALREKRALDDKRALEDMLRQQTTPAPRTHAPPPRAPATAGADARQPLAKPLQIAPPAAHAPTPVPAPGGRPSALAPAPRGAAPDPSTAGRY